VQISKECCADLKRVLCRSQKSAVQISKECCADLKRLRANVNDFSAHIYSHGKSLAERSGISVSMPRIASKQKDHANASFTSPEVYFKQSITIQFLDRLISELTTTFSEHTKKASLVEHLKIKPSSSARDISDAIFYEDDLPNSSVADEEYE